YGREWSANTRGTARSSGFPWASALLGLPNGSRLSCGAPKKDSFPNLCAPPASSACEAAAFSCACLSSIQASQRKNTAPQKSACREHEARVGARPRPWFEGKPYEDAGGKEC